MDQGLTSQKILKTGSPADKQDQTHRSNTGILNSPAPEEKADPTNNLDTTSTLDTVEQGLRAEILVRYPQASISPLPVESAESESEKTRYIFQVSLPDGTTLVAKATCVTELFDKRHAMFREEDLATNLCHPGVYKGIGSVLTNRVGDVPYKILYYEHIKGESLKTILSRAPIPVDRALRILESALQAIHYLQTQQDDPESGAVVHRDIKPSNIIIREGTDEVVLIDLGSATSVKPFTKGQEDHTRTVVFSATLKYASPATISGKPDMSSDLFSLGLTLYESLIGVYPRAVNENDSHSFPRYLIPENLPVALTQGGSQTRIPALLRDYLHRMFAGNYEHKKKQRQLSPFRDAKEALAALEVLKRELAPKSPASRLNDLLGAMCGILFKDLSPLIPRNALGRMRAFLAKKRTKEARPIKHPRMPKSLWHNSSVAGVIKHLQENCSTILSSETVKNLRTAHQYAQTSGLTPSGLVKVFEPQDENPPHNFEQMVVRYAHFKADMVYQTLGSLLKKCEDSQNAYEKLHGRLWKIITDDANYQYEGYWPQISKDAHLPVHKDTALLRSLMNRQIQLERSGNRLDLLASYVIGKLLRTEGLTKLEEIAKASQAQLEKAQVEFDKSVEETNAAAEKNLVSVRALANTSFLYATVSPWYHSRGSADAYSYNGFHLSCSIFVRDADGQTHEICLNKWDWRYNSKAFQDRLETFYTFEDLQNHIRVRTGDGVGLVLNEHLDSEGFPDVFLIPQDIAPRIPGWFVSSKYQPEPDANKTPRETEKPGAWFKALEQEGLDSLKRREEISQWKDKGFFFKNITDGKEASAHVGAIVHCLSDYQPWADNILANPNSIHVSPDGQLSINIRGIALAGPPAYIIVVDGFACLVPGKPLSKEESRQFRPPNFVGRGQYIFRKLNSDAKKIIRSAVAIFQTKIGDRNVPVYLSQSGDLFTTILQWGAFRHAEPKIRRLGHTLIYKEGQLVLEWNLNPPREYDARIRVSDFNDEGIWEWVR